jgi:hypothetical protein
MTVKSRVDGEDATTDNMGERITAAQQEKWKVHKWVDEEEEEAWQFYGDNLFVGAEEKIESTEELMKKYPALSSSLLNMEYMDTISAPNDFAKVSRNRAQKTKKGGKGKETAGMGENGAEEDSDDSQEDE